MRISTTTTPEMTSEQLFLRGTFSLWKFEVPYYTSVVPWDFARDKFKLLEDVGGTAVGDWSIEELFQREIDWSRVEGSIVKYLKNEALPQFFNALTVALLPCDGDSLAAKYTSAITYDPMPDADHSLEECKQVGGIQLASFIGTNGSVGKLRWDTKAIAAVAVDGQHRLAAIKELGTRAPEANRGRTGIPVIFLIPDPSLGFRDPAMDATTGHKATIRRIFIDLNKHAVKLDLRREILLDDYDVHRVCMRTMITDRLASSDNSRLPLALVDWVSEKNKIDTGPFMTSVVLLENLMYEILSKQPELESRYSDNEDDQATAEDELSKVETWINTAFSPSDEQRDELMSRARRCFDGEVRLTWESEHLEIFKSLFVQNWRPHLVRMFAEIAPYGRLWQAAKKSGMLDPAFSSLYVATLKKDPRSRRRAEEITERLQRNPGWSRSINFDAPLDEVNALKKDNWAFAVVFQKALFRSYRLLVRERGVLGCADETAFTTSWIKAINVMFERTPLFRVDYAFSNPKKEFWAGLGRKLGAIDFTGSGQERLARVLSTWVCMIACKKEVPTYAAMKSAKAGTLEKLIYRMLNHTSVRAGMKQIADTPDFDEEAEKELRIRYDHLRKLSSES